MAINRKRFYVACMGAFMLLCFMGNGHAHNLNRLNERKGLHSFETTFRLSESSVDKIHETKSRTYTSPLAEDGQTASSEIVNPASGQAFVSLPAPPASTTDGDWNDPATWDNTSIPTATDDITITNGHTVTISTTDAQCRNIIIESGGELIVTGSGILTVAGNLINNGTLTANNGSTINLSGNWTNNDTFTPNDGTVTFTTAGSTINGTTTFGNLHIDAGSDVNSEVAVLSTINVNNLLLENGLLKIDGGSTSITHLNNPSSHPDHNTIPESAGIEVNSGATLTTGDFTISNEGLLRINNGTATLGNSSGNSVNTQFDGAFIVNGGNVSIAGRLHNSASGELLPGITSGITITDGTVTLGTAGNGLSNTGTLDVTAAGNFDFSGGNIVFQEASSATTAIDLKFISGGGNKFIDTDAYFQFGNASTSTGSTFIVSSEVDIPNISANGNAHIELTSDLKITESYSFAAGLTLNGHNVAIPITDSAAHIIHLEDESGNPIPITFQLTSGTPNTGASISISSLGVKHPDNNSGTNYLKRYWEFAASNFTSPSFQIDATFLPGDVVGSASNFTGGSYNGSAWSKVSGSTVNSNVLSISNVGTTSSFTALSQPGVSITASSNPICEGSSTQLNANTTGDPITNYAWSPSTGLSATNIANPVASPGSTITYTVVVTDENGLTATDNIEITVDPAPTASAGGSQTICQNETATVSGASAANGTISWSHDGTGNLSDETTLNPTYTPSASDAGTTVTLTMMVTSTNACSPQAATADYTVIVEPLPSASAGGSQTICQDATATVSGASASNGTILWTHDGTGSLTNQTTLTPTYSPGTGDPGNTVTLTMTVTSDNSCGSETATANYSINVEPLPSASAGGSQTICSYETATVSGASAANGTISWSHDGTGSLTNGNSLTPTYTPGSGDAGNTVTLTMTVTSTNACSPQTAVATYTVEVLPYPTANNPGPKTYCQLETTTAIPLTGTPSGVVFDVTGGSSIGINDLSDVTEIPSFTATTPGSATLEITPKANGCVGDPVYMDITVVSIPIPSATPSSRTICSGESTDIQYSSGTAGTTFTWEVINVNGGITGASDGSGDHLDQVLVNNTATNGSVTYQVTSYANGCEGGKINTTITVEPFVDADISGGTTVCQTDTEPVVTFSATGGTGPYTFTYNINGGSTQQITTSSGNTATLNAPTSADGTFVYNLLSVSGNTSCEYPINESATITVNTLPTLTSSLTPPGICSNETFNYTPTSNAPGTSFNWSRDAVAGISNPAETGTDDPDEILVNTTNTPIAVTYRYTLQTPQACSNTEEVVVVVTPTPILTSSLPSDPICSGDVFSYTPSSNVTSGVIYSWTRPAVAGNPAASGSGAINEVLVNNTGSNVGVTYTYTLSSNDCSNPTTYDVPIVVVPAPTVTASASETIICQGGTVDLSSSSNVTSSKPPTLLSESFNSASQGNTTGPNGWLTDYNNNDARWTIRQNNYSHDGRTFSSNDNSLFYLTSSRAAGNVDITSRLTSPAINTEGYTSLQVSFWQYYRNGNSSDHPEILVSTNGSSWTEIDEQTSSDGSSDNFSQYTVNLNSYVGYSTLYIRFQFRARDDYYWAIDNVEVSGTPSSAADISWTSSPAGFSSTDANPTNVSPTETTTYTVTYTDPDTGCDGSESVTVTVRDEPDATIRADYCVVSPKIRLTTVAGYASYDWSPLPVGATNGQNYIDVDLAGDYSVTVVDANGCVGNGYINVGTQNEIDGNFTNFNPSSPDFFTEYTQNQSYYSGDGSTGLWPEGYYAVNTTAWSNYPNSPDGYHPNFHGADHTNNTSGDRNFLMVNGSTDLIQDTDGSWRQRIIWQRTITVKPNTDYYFSAWAMNLNPTSPAELQFEINGVLVGTIANLDAAEKPTSEGEVGISNWVRFYSNPLWNSGSATTAVIRIRNLNTVAGGNDFGIDDIAFGELNPSPAEIGPASSNDDLCDGEDIELLANVDGGKEPITFLWTGPNGFSSTEENPVITSDDPAYPGPGNHTYTLEVDDWYGCEISPESTSVTVHQQATAAVGPDQIICSDYPEITINGSIGGVASSATWSSSGNGTFTDASSLTTTYTASEDDISAGSVVLSLTTDDPTGPCPAGVGSMTLTITPSPHLTVDVTVPECSGESNGYATVNVTGGTGNLSYLWSDGQTTQTATNLSDGTYTVTVSDEAGCSTVSEPVEVKEPEPLVVYPPSYTTPVCYGGNDGTATINASGGTQPYQYEWTDAPGNPTTQTATGLSDGVYWFTVTDANECKITTDFVLVTNPEDTELICPLPPDPVQAPANTPYADVALDDPIYDPNCQTISWTMSGATTASTPTAGFVPSPYTFNVGTTTVRYEVVNTAGETQECSFNVVVLLEPQITCPANILHNTNTGLCTYTVNPGVPTLNDGAEPIDWTWTITDPSGTQVASGTSTTPDDGATPTPIGDYTFEAGTSTITWHAENISGDDECTQTVTVEDHEPATFTAPTLSECVDNLFQASYSGSSLSKSPDPDHHTFNDGDTALDLTDLLDNCCDEADLTIHWRIEFSDTPDPGNPSGPALTHADITGTGQPSTYGSDILLWGDGVNFTEVTHHIFYWVDDCNGNTTAETDKTITVKPRPQIN